VLSRTISCGATVTRVEERLPRSHLLEQELEPAPSDLKEVLPDRGQRWGEEGRFGNVVEADDAHGGRKPAALLVEDAEQAERHRADVEGDG
jgi:hypothetical protein